MGENASLECIGQGRPRPIFAITPEGTWTASAKPNKAGSNSYRALFKTKHSLELKDAGNVSCKVYYKYSAIKSEAQATINSKKHMSISSRYYFNNICIA